ncbi:MAG: hypothetical protein RLZZ401_438 [Pseudomonadota bacterium]|jgi:cytoskeleton protein RodZ
MSEAPESSVEEGQPLIDGGPVAAGALLRQARERVGLHIGALAVALKVPVKKIEALEAGQIEVLSEPVFVRGLASSICRHLKIDPAPVLALLPQPQAQVLARSHELNAPFRSAGEGARLVSGARLLTAPVLAVAALLLGAGALIIWPAAPLMSDNPESLAALVIQPSPASRALEPAVPVPVFPSVVMSPGDAAPSPVAMPVVSVDTAAGTASAATGPGLLRFKALGESWVEVTDANGAAVLRKTLAAGETSDVDATTRLHVVIGRADVTEVMVRGRRLDLQASTKVNVARFEVTP